MSLIEQAAKRLDELRRAGADLSHPQPPASGNSIDSSDVAPTPEAFVRAMDARAAHPVLIPSVRHERVESPLAATSARSPIAHPSPRRAEIDLKQLAVRGYLTPDSPKSPLADEFRVVKRPIIHNAFSRDAKGKNRNLVMVTSALPAEGKTFTAINLAMSVAAEFDTTVLLVDGDVAHPMLPDILNVPGEPGLLDLLTRDDLDVADALVKTNVDQLVVLPTGTRQRRATELLASEQMIALLGELASRYPDRLIIFDSPPLLATTEARVLATHMGQIILVVGADATSQYAVNQALATIESCEIVLMLLNKARQTDVGSYYGYYTDDGAS
jgi:exopolysaccharide/PEP-CTERM locus tyrosine autokinase